MTRQVITAMARWIGALVIAVALGFQAWADLTFGTFTWVQLPAYFTPLANLVGIAALTAAGIFSIRGRGEPRWVSLLRVNATTYLVIVAVVYWSLLAPYAYVKLPWANGVIHGGAAVVLLADWLLARPRRPLPRRSVWTVLSLPVAWLGYLAARAALDGWIPYPFLDISRGALPVLATVAGLTCAVLATAATLHRVPRAGVPARSTGR